MVDAVGPAQFSTIKYEKDGEQISATKQGSTVTLVGDKNGTRQMSLQDFTQQELPNAKDIKLEKAPDQDEVIIGATKQIWDNPSDVVKEAGLEEGKVGKNLDVAA